MATGGRKLIPVDFRSPPRKPCEERERKKQQAALPQYAVADLDMPPANLPEEAAVVWDELAPTFKGRGIITDADITLFSEICSIISDMRKYKEAIDADGMTVDGSNGGKVKHPLISPLNSLRVMLRSYLCEIGWTPGSRSKVVRAGSEEENGQSEDPIEDIVG